MVTSYECYVCNNQEDNNGKCIRTVRTCNLDDNSCMTVVRWGSKFFMFTHYYPTFFILFCSLFNLGTPYWDPTGQKQYYISKRCTTLVNLPEKSIADQILNFHFFKTKNTGSMSGST